MILTNIKAKNYKTYKDLNINVEPTENKPIILIGGLNGGGKTTFFEVIYHALYGIRIKNVEHFMQLYSASAEISSELKIELELSFKGYVVNQESVYTIQRVYYLRDNNLRESVTLVKDGERYSYGTATPQRQRIEAEYEINKIIKSYLPQELSQYFLFDAMKAGSLLNKNKLGAVIKENIDNVMGFNKYDILKRSATDISEKLKLDLIKEEDKRARYQALLNEKEAIIASIENCNKTIRELKAYLDQEFDNYKNAKEGFDVSENHSNQLKYYEKKLEDYQLMIQEYQSLINKYMDTIELQSIMPKAMSLLSQSVMKIIEEQEKDTSLALSKDHIDTLSNDLIEFLGDKTELSKDSSFTTNLHQFLTDKYNNMKSRGVFTLDEINVLKNYLSNHYVNNYNSLMKRKEEIRYESKNESLYKNRIEEIKKSIGNNDNTAFITSYANKQEKVLHADTQIKEFQEKLVTIEEALEEISSGNNNNANQRIDLLSKVEKVLTESSKRILARKKSIIEKTMVEDLNKILYAYAGYIGEVKLTDGLENLDFKIYHTKGNEISLEQLNAASKQILVQVLLKVLHQYGDFDPPVMIDTVTGFLDQESRNALFQHYFPKLSSQTILLSTPTEITKENDLETLKPYISKSFTIVRDQENQCSSIISGYFN